MMTMLKCKPLSRVQPLNRPCLSSSQLPRLSQLLRLSPPVNNLPNRNPLQLNRTQQPSNSQLPEVITMPSPTLEQTTTVEMVIQMPEQVMVVKSLPSSEFDETQERTWLTKSVRKNRNLNYILISAKLPQALTIILYTSSTKRNKYFNL